MSKQNIIKKIAKKITNLLNLRELARRAITTIILIFVAIATVYVYAAFVEPSVGPADSDQDFAQNILGANDGNNDFLSSSVAGNDDGSLIERLEQIKIDLDAVLVDTGTTLDDFIDTEIGANNDAASMSGSLFAGQQYIWDNRASVSKRVFVTNSTYNGDLGGLAGADAKCQSEADTASLGGTWKAIISTTSGNASARIGHNWTTLVDMKGNIVAYYIVLDVTPAIVPGLWNMIADPDYLFNPIEFDQNGTLHSSAYVWTGSTTSGNNTYFGGHNCRNFTYTGADERAPAARSSNTDASWINDSTSRYCNQLSRLYCIEQ